MSKGRKKIKWKKVKKSLKNLEKRIKEKLEEKGNGSFVSSHEILGVIEEELLELKGAIHSNLEIMDVREELYDVAIGALFGATCIESGGI